MSDIIQLLPDSVANQIAAGEVIQRPASVIKELVENAVDASAKTINVLVVDAGKTSVQVIDDGKGMSDTDARLSFERHATSKIRKADDLFALHTMGFRGEALASIAAVAQVELKTRQPSDELGTHLSIAGGQFTGQEPCSAPVGSNFLIENLFYNVPARRKFLKSNTTELNNIVTAFQRIALVYPDISFTLHSNGVEMMNLRAGTLRQRIIEVFGKRLNHELLPIEVETSLCNIHGFIGKPDAAKKKGAHQYLFVNERYMKHPYFHKAIMTAYERLILAGEQVPYFVYFNVPAENIDVNIHPTKTEIKFENEQAIWKILMATVKEAIGKFSEVPSIDFDTEGSLDIPAYMPGVDAIAPKVDFNPNYNPFRQSGNADSGRKADNWEELYAGLSEQKGESLGTFFPETDASLSGFEGEEDSLFPSKSNETDAFSGSDEREGEAEILPSRMSPFLEDKSPVHYQYKGSYIMTAVKSGLMVIHQHRAHVRVLYEQYLKQFAEHQGHTQKVLFPEVVQFSAADLVVFEKVKKEMSEIGFQLDNLGAGSFAVNGVPAGLEGLNVITLVQDMITSAKEDGVSVAQEIYKSLASSLARNAAIPQGQVLSNEEMDTLVNELFACRNVNYTPSGKPIIAVLKQQDIDSLF